MIPRRELGEQFTKRETEIIVAICKELTNKQIASQLNISVRTVEGYRERILMKMNVHNTAGITIFAIRHGLFKL